MRPSSLKLSQRWDLLRIVLMVLVALTTLLLLCAIPAPWWVVILPLVMFSVAAAAVSVAYGRIFWLRLSLLGQGTLFAVGLCFAISELYGDTSAPILLLGFCMLLATEHMLDTTLRYSGQFTLQGTELVRASNEPALSASLNHLCLLFVRDGAIFITGFLLAVAIAVLRVGTQNVPVISDPSLFVIVASISLALLIALKSE